MQCLAHWLAKGHVSFCYHLASIVCHALSHLNLLLCKHRTKLKQTRLGWSLGCPLSKYVQQPHPTFKVAAIAQTEMCICQNEHTF